MRYMLLAAFLACAAGGAMAAPAASDAELDDQRGGFSVGEVAFEFGAVVRTFENGALALQTQVTWTSQGAVVNTTAAPGVVPDLALSAMSGAGAFSTASGASVIHNVADGQLANVLLNTASGRDFRQETDATLTLPGFAGVQGDIARNLAGLRLADDVANGAIRAAR